MRLARASLASLESDSDSEVAELTEPEDDESDEEFTADSDVEKEARAAAAIIVRTVISFISACRLTDIVHDYRLAWPSRRPALLVSLA